MIRLARDLALPLDVVAETMAVLAKKGAGKTYLGLLIAEQAFASGVQCVAFDPTGVWWGLRYTADGKGDSGLDFVILGGEHGDLPLEPTSGQLIADVIVDSGRSFVLDLSGFESDADQQRFVTALVKRLYRRKASARSNTLLLLDEADEFAPQQPLPGQRVMLGAFEQVVKRGRSRGLGIIMFTLRSASLNKNVLTQIDTLVAMRTPSPQDQEAIALWVKKKANLGLAGKMMESLDELPTGEAWVWNPERKIFKRIKVQARATFDSSFTPKPGEVKPEPVAVVEIDLDHLGAEIAATKERADANDPKKLRAEVARLRAELEKGSPVAVAPGPENEPEWSDYFLGLGWRHPDDEPLRVEVPVLDAVLVKQLHESLDGGVTTLREVAVGIADDLHFRLESVEEAAKLIVRSLEVHQDRPAAPPRLSVASRRATPSAPPTVAPSASSGPEAALERGASGGANLSGPQQKVLNAVAFYRSIGIETPTKQQVGIVAGYKVSKKLGGTFGNVLGSLHTEGLVEYPLGGVSLTAAGARLAFVPDVPPTNEGVQVEVLSRLSGPQQRVLGPLLGRYPQGLSKLEVGARAGYQLDGKVGGTFGNVLGSLHTLGLVEYQGTEAFAADVLFPLGSS